MKKNILDTNAYTRLLAGNEEIPDSIIVPYPSSPLPAALYPLSSIPRYSYFSER